jgi:hypothetical protein
MKQLTRMMAFLSFLVMFQYGAYAQSGNKVYVDQIGSGSVINFTQTGQSNEIGNSTNRATVNGNNNTITIEQIGNSNITSLNIQGDGATISSSVTGNSNTIDISCGVSGACGASSITNTIEGNGNQVTQQSDNLIDSTVNISSDNNTVNIINTSTAIGGAKSLVDISGGNGNLVDITQAGPAGTNGHDASVAIVGATNTVDVRQGGSVDSKVVSTITGSGNALTIKSNHN